MSHPTTKLSSPFLADRHGAVQGITGSRRFALMSAMLAALVLSGCGSHDEAVSPIPTTPPPSGTAAVSPLPGSTGALAMAMSNPASGLSFSSVELGLSADAEHRVHTTASHFSPTNTIHAAVETMGSGEAVLSAVWTYQDGSVVHQESRSIKANGPRATEFTLARPGGLAVGDYTLKISLNGNPVDRTDFSIR